MTPEIEQRMRKKCEAIARYYDPGQQTGICEEGKEGRVIYVCLSLVIVDICMALCGQNITHVLFTVMHVMHRHACTGQGHPASRHNETAHA